LHEKDKLYAGKKKSIKSTIISCAKKVRGYNTWIAANDRISLGVKMSPEQVMAEMFAATK
jgi:hypothetical protein